MSRPCVTVDAPMLAATVGINAGVEPDIGAVVVIDYGAGAVMKKLRTGPRVLCRIETRIALQVNACKALRLLFILKRYNGPRIAGKQGGSKPPHVGPYNTGFCKQVLAHFPLRFSLVPNQP